MEIKRVYGTDRIFGVYGPNGQFGSIFETRFGKFLVTIRRVDTLVDSMAEAVALIEKEG